MSNINNQYLTIDPLELWKELKIRSDHQRMVILPKALYDCRNLRIKDYKSVDEYNSALLKIVFEMKLCGEEVNDKDMLEKTFSTFHSTNMLLQQRYRKKGFTTYASLISCLLQAEQNDEFLIKDSEMRSPGSTPLPNTHLAKNTK